jgi:hypothetical protein
MLTSAIVVGGDRIVVVSVANRQARPRWNANGFFK